MLFFVRETAKINQRDAQRIRTGSRRVSEACAPQGQRPLEEKKKTPNRRCITVFNILITESMTRGLFVFKLFKII